MLNAEYIFAKYTENIFQIHIKFFMLIIFKLKY